MGVVDSQLDERISQTDLNSQLGLAGDYPDNPGCNKQRRAPPGQSLGYTSRSRFQTIIPLSSVLDTGTVDELERTGMDSALAADLTGTDPSASPFIPPGAALRARTPTQ